MDQATIDALRTLSIPDQMHLIDGQHVAAQSGALIDVFSPIDGTRLTGIAAGTKADADRAVAAARRTFEAGTWAKQPPLNARRC